MFEAGGAVDKEETIASPPDSFGRTESDINVPNSTEGGGKRDRSGTTFRTG